MATVYKAEIVSDWVNYSKEELQKILNEAIKNIEQKNKINIKIKLT